MICEIVLAVLAGVQNPAEAKVLGEAAARLDHNAQRWYDVGFFGRAKKIWLEVLHEYEPDDEAARKALGFMRFGTVWAPDESVHYPVKDTAPPSRARSLEKKWKALARWLGAQHLELARELAGSDPARSRYHYRRVLRFLPDDERAGAALGYRRFEGVYASPPELRILRRSRLLRQVADNLKRYDFPVRRLPATEREPLLARVGRYVGVRSEHFTVWGDHDFELLEGAARMAERALWLCRTAFAGARGYRHDPLESASFALFRKRSTWQVVLRDNAGYFEPEYLRFLLANCQSAYVNEGSRFLYVAAESDPDVLFDLVVRTVAADLANLRSDALEEGIGHTLVAMLFGRNLVYLVGQHTERPSGHTVSKPAGATPRAVLHPDLEAWLEAGIEQAWERPGASLAGLPLVPVDQFGIDDRVRSWAYCDYLVRRDPDLLRCLDEAANGAGSAGDVALAYGGTSAGIALSDLDDAWQRFWIEDTRLLRLTMLPPSRRTSHRARQANAWMAAISRQRLGCGLPPVGWIELDPGVGDDLVQHVKKNGHPSSGDAGAHSTLWSRGGQPDEQVATWMQIPGFRHALLDQRLTLIGYADRSGVALFDVSVPGPTGATDAEVYPRRDTTGVPVAVPSRPLGDGLHPLWNESRPGVVPDEIGMPITLHLFGVDPAGLSGVECLVRCNDEVVAGFVYVSDGSCDRRLDAPGLVTFFPTQPLGGNAVVTVKWSWNEGRQRRRLSYRFSTG